jgi:Ca2+-binding RTX toxin-like protein
MKPPMRALVIILVLVGAAATAMPGVAHAAVTLCDGKVATVVGTPGDDVLQGTPAGDVIAGLGGDDVILAGGGDDVMCGGAGADRLYGEDGNDALFAGRAGRIRDRFVPDRLDGGPDDDRLEIGREHSSLGTGVSGVITFGTATAGLVVDLTEHSAVGDGNDTVNPRPGLRLVGTPDDDVLSGSAFSEAIRGRAGSDAIRGRPGNDWLDAGSGTDEVRAGVGRDTCLHAELRRRCEIVSP